MENEETKKISIDDTLELLKCSWQLTENNFEKESPKYYSKWDQKVLSNKDGVQLKMSYFFPTHLCPHPWWGNIESPKMIVLTLNPSYAPFDDEKDETNREFKSLWLNGIKNPTKKINLLNFNETKTFDWWRDVFEKKEKQEMVHTLLKNKEKFIEKVGVFNLLGYHSLKYSKLPSKALKDEEKIKEDIKEFCCKFDSIKNALELEMKKEIQNYNFSYLPTQNAVRLHVENLIYGNPNMYIVIIWGYKHWEELGLEFKNHSHKNILVVNSYNSVNKKIFNSHVGEKRTTKVNFHDFYKGNETNSFEEREKHYKEFYEKLKKVIE